RASRHGISASFPAQVTFRRGNQTLTGYPALVDEGASVAIRLLDTKDKAAQAHRDGVKRLMALDLKEQVRNLERALPAFNQLALKFNAVIPADKLKADLVEAIVDRAFIGEDEPPRTPKAFEEQKKRAKARLPAVVEGASRYATAIGDASQQFNQVAAQSSSLGRVTQEAKAMRERMVYPGFLARTPWERLEHVPRYVKGYALRLQKYRGNPERDQKHAGNVAALWNNYEARLKADRDAGRIDPKLEEFRWLIEELRVSLFAQELRTPFPVSAKRLQKFWDENLR
ncbi:MAG TPA: DUF3418 domain-containing protein, partial [Usitatibacter sp.]|nr:DUF3418 domain-containing protein [Usitatibacter sp.]